MKLRQLLTLCLVAVLLAGAAVTAAPAAALASAPAANAAQADDVSGTYVSNVYPAASAPGLVMLMSLYPNNNAEVVNFYFSNPPITETGTWELSEGKVVVTLTENDNGKYDTPSKETFDVQGDMLVSGAFEFQKLGVVTPEELEAASSEAAATEPVTSTEAMTGTEEVAATEETTATEGTSATAEMTETAPMTGTEEMTDTTAASGGAYAVFVTDVYPAADASGMVQLMVLYPNMNMEQLTVYLGKDNVHEVGTWSDTNPGVVDVTVTGPFDGKEYDSPVTTAYTRDGDILSDGVFSFSPLPIVTPADMEAMANPAGTYVSKLYPAADASGLMIILSLFDNNNAEQVSYYVAKATITEQGTWKQNDDGTITVSITGSGDQTYAKPMDTTYTRTGDLISDGTFELTRAEVVTPEQLAASGGATGLPAEGGTEGVAAGDTSGTTAGAAGTTDLAGTSWVWTQTLMSDDTKTTPAQPDAFQLTFGADGSVSTTTDCNTNAGSYKVDGNQIKLDFQISTMMACPNDAQEANYIKDLLGVQSYLISDGNLVLEFPMDSGTMTFAPAPAK
ncbi:MAG: META domain-containing protein [Caldilineaceae bacterium]